MDCMALRQANKLFSFLHIGLTDQDDGFALIAGICYVYQFIECIQK